MAVSVTINGSSYSFPATGDENWGDQVTQWAQAVSLHLLQKTGGTFTLTNDVNFGPSFGLKSLYYKTLAANVSNTGAVRLGNSEGFGWRNNANTADLLISVDSSDILNFNGTPIAISIGAANTVYVSNGTSPTWALLVNANINAAAAIAYSKLNLTGLVVNADLAAAAGVARTKIASGTNDHVVINDGSGVLSSETALSPVRGGTGVANNAAATLTRSGNFALTLTTTASTNVTLPTAGTLATTTLSVVNKTTTYLATSNDNVITADATSGAFTITLPASASNSGKLLTFKKTDATTSAVTIDGNLSETIDGATTTTLNTQNETLVIVSDGTNWQTISRRNATEWTSYTPTGGWTTNATYTGKWRRSGDSMEVQVAVALTGAPTGTFQPTIPTGYTIDTAKLAASTSVHQVLGPAYGFRSGSAYYAGVTVYGTTGTVLVISNTVTNYWSPTIPVTWGSGDTLSVNFRVPITGWKA